MAELTNLYMIYIFFLLTVFTTSLVGHTGGKAGPTPSNKADYKINTQVTNEL